MYKTFGGTCKLLVNVCLILFLIPHRPIQGVLNASLGYSFLVNVTIYVSCGFFKFLFKNLYLKLDGMEVDSKLAVSR